jgi:hemerythrin-like domain-containing protein
MTTTEKRPRRTHPDLDGPADTRMMRIVHTALRRDLARTQVALAELAADPDDDRREAVAAHVLWMMTWLHHHHEGEDEGLYPYVRARNPKAAALLDEMDADHQRIVPAMAAVERAAASYATSPDSRADVAAALDALLDGLLPHLQREEEEMMPVVSATITDREWREWDEKSNIAPLSKKELAASGLWIIDGLEGEDYEHVSHLVPPVPRFLISKVLVHGYRRQANRRWGTPS